MKLDMITLQGYEPERLKLEGAEIITYAVLFKASCFGIITLSQEALDYECIGITEWLDVLYAGVPRPHVSAVIDRLIAKGLVEKSDKGYKFKKELSD